MHFVSLDLCSPDLNPKPLTMRTCIWFPRALDEETVLHRLWSHAVDVLHTSTSSRPLDGLVYKAFGLK